MKRRCAGNLQTLGDEVLKNLQVEIMEEFPPTKELPSMLTDRGYELLPQDEIFKT